MPAREYPMSFGQYTKVLVDAKVSLSLRGRDALKPACFNFDAYVVLQRRAGHFLWSRLVLGRRFMEDYAVGMNGDDTKGQLYFKDDYRGFYGQSYQKKTSNY